MSGRLTLVGLEHDAHHAFVQLVTRGYPDITVMKVLGEAPVCGAAAVPHRLPQVQFLSLHQPQHVLSTAMHRIDLASLPAGWYTTHAATLCQDCTQLQCWYGLSYESCVYPNLALLSVVCQANRCTTGSEFYIFLPTASGSRIFC